MSTIYYSHAVCLEHEPGYRHPESPARLKAVEAAPPYRLANGEAAPLAHTPGSRPNEAPVPRIGEQSRDVLAALGLAETDIDALAKSGVIACPAAK